MFFVNFFLGVYFCGKLSSVRLAIFLLNLLVCFSSLIDEWLLTPFLLNLCLLSFYESFNFSFDVSGSTVWLSFLPPEFWLTSFTDPVYLWEVCGVSSPSQFFLQEYLIFLRGGLMSFIIYGHIFIYFFSFSNLSLKAYSDKACWGSKWVDRYFSRITSFLG